MNWPFNNTARSISPFHNNIFIIIVIVFLQIRAFIGVALRLVPYEK